MKTITRIFLSTFIFFLTLLFAAQPANPAAASSPVPYLVTDINPGSDSSQNITAVTPAGAAALTVTTTTDELSSPGTGCSLREAIVNANADANTYTECTAGSGADTITVPAGTYTLTIAGINEDAAATGDVDITSDITITGAGAGSTIIDGGALDRVIHVTGAYTVNISGVTIQNGKITANNGGGIYNADGILTVTNSTFSGNSALSGGGIYNELGTLTVTNSTFSGNIIEEGGGGISNEDGTLTVTNSTFSGNSSKPTTGGDGGGIYNDNNAQTVTVTNSTFSGNSMLGTGGGIYNWGMMTVTNSTFSGNSAIKSSGGIYTDTPGTTTLKNTIVANNPTGGNCINNGGTFTAGTDSMSDTVGCGGATVSASINLGGLTGSPAYFPLLSGSVAIDAGTNSGCPADSQNGVTHLAGGTCDIGSYETPFVIFNGNGFTSGSTAAQSANVATALRSNGFTRIGYTFANWSTLIGGGGTTYANNASYPFTNSVILYAQWTIIPSHTVTFNANGGTGTMAAQTASVATALTANAFTRTGYSFNGWNTISGGGGTAYADGASYPFTSNVTLYAQWSINISIDTVSPEAITMLPPNITPIVAPNTQALACNTFEYWGLSADVQVPGVVYSGLKSWNQTITGSPALPIPVDTAAVLLSWSNSFPPSASGTWTFNVTPKDAAGNSAGTFMFRNIVASPNAAELAACKSFTDIAGDANEVQIRYLASLGIIAGYSDGTFKSTNILSRAEIATLFVRANNSTLVTSPSTDCSFTDVVSPRDWFAQYVWTACSLKFMVGNGDGTFTPNATFTRGQAVTILNNLATSALVGTGYFARQSADYVTVLNSGTTLWNDPSPYRSIAWTDVPLGEYYTAGANYAYNAGVAEATGATTFSPGQPILRGEFAKMLYRALSRINQ